MSGTHPIDWRERQHSDPTADKRAPGSGLPRHYSARAKAQEPKRSRLWAVHETFHEPAPLFGVFPLGFLEWIHPLLGHPWHRELLHVCSGALGPEVLGIRVDLARRAAPDVIADGRRLPFVSGSFRAVLLDPPYTREYAESLYQTDYPRPSHLLREAARVTRPGGRIAFVHFLVPNPPPGTSIVTVRGLTQGCGYRIRAVTIYEREQVGLFPR